MCRLKFALAILIAPIWCLSLGLALFAWMLSELSAPWTTPCSIVSSIAIPFILPWAVTSLALEKLGVRVI